nr:restriction endonuclease subunit S [uncultured Marinifilum sp.]
MKVNKLVIQDVCTFVGGSQPPKSIFSYKCLDGYVRLIQTRDYKTDNFLTYIPENSTNKFCVEKDIMIGRYGPPVFQICRGLKGAYNVALMKAVPKSNIRNDYLYYFLKQETIFQYVDRLSKRTGGQTGVDLVALNQYPILLPDIDSQKEIEHVLLSIDDKINLNNRINTELEGMAKLLYDYWFVQFDFPDKNGKPYKSSGGKMIYNQDLKREIPEGWEVKKLVDEMDVQYGFPFSTKLFNEDEIGKPIIRIRDILNNSVSLFSTEKVDSKYLLEKGDLLVGMDGNFHMNFWDKNDCYLNQRCVRIRKKNTSTTTHFQALFDIKPHIEAREKNVSRTTVGHLSAKDINGLNVLIPSSKELIENTKVFDSILDKIITNRNENQQLTSLRDWLLPMLMNGQVTVKEAEEKVNSFAMAAELNAKYKTNQ